MVNADISNVWCAISLPDLLGAEKTVFDAHLALTAAAEPEGESCPWGFVPEEIEPVLEAARQIAESDALVVLGGNPVCRAAQGAIELLQGRYRNGDREKLPVFFAGESLSSRDWNRLVKMLEGKDFSVCVISDAGRDPQPFAALRGLKWILERRFGTDGAKKRIFAVAGPRDDTLAQMAQENGWKLLRATGEDPYSLSAWSAAGLLPMAAAGLDAAQVLQGVREAREEFDLRSFENPVWLYAALRTVFFRQNRRTEILGTSEPDFRTLGSWWQSLFAPGDVYPAAACGDRTQLLFRLGADDVFETELRFDPPENAAVIGDSASDTDGLNALAGCTLEAVQAQLADEWAQLREDAGVPAITLECAELTERTLGQLLYFFGLGSALAKQLGGAGTASGR